VEEHDELKLLPYVPWDVVVASRGFHAYRESLVLVGDEQEDLQRMRLVNVEVQGGVPSLVALAFVCKHKYNNGNLINSLMKLLKI
jgi:hypothetical protein